MIDLLEKLNEADFADQFQPASNEDLLGRSKDEVDILRSQLSNDELIIRQSVYDPEKYLVYPKNPTWDRERNNSPSVLPNVYGTDNSKSVEGMDLIFGGEGWKKYISTVDEYAKNDREILSRGGYAFILKDEEKYSVYNKGGINDGRSIKIITHNYPDKTTSEVLTQYFGNDEWKKYIPTEDEHLKVFLDWAISGAGYDEWLRPTGFYEFNNQISDGNYNGLDSAMIDTFGVAGYYGKRAINVKKALDKAVEKGYAETQGAGRSQVYRIKRMEGFEEAEKYYDKNNKSRRQRKKLVKKGSTFKQAADMISKAMGSKWFSMYELEKKLSEENKTYFMRGLKPAGWNFSTFLKNLESKGFIEHKWTGWTDLYKVGKGKK